MARYPSKECEGCSVILEREQAEKNARNSDGSWKYPVFELATCSCFRLAPEGCLIVKRIEEERL